MSNSVVIYYGNFNLFVPPAPSLWTKEEFMAAMLNIVTKNNVVKFASMINQMKIMQVTSAFYKATMTDS